LKYREQRPSGELRRFVDCFWFLEQEDSDACGQRPVERLLPIGSTEVVLHHGSSFREWIGGEPTLLPPGVIAGQLTGPLFIQPAGPVETMGLRFLPGGAYPFFGARLDVLTGRIASFEEVWGGEGGRFEQRLLAATDDPERVRVAESFLLSRLAGGGRRDEPVETAAQEIRRRRGRISVSALGRSLGISGRQMERRFGAALGIGPKSLCRVVRFQSLLRRLARATTPDWAGMAVDCGFSDQSHLINEVRRLSGTTPRGLAEKRAAGAGSDPGFTLDGESGLRVCPAGP
jgi:AraC-like DNA-binding protein